MVAGVARRRAPRLGRLRRHVPVRAGEAARYGQAPLPETFDDPPNAGFPIDASQQAAEELSRETARAVSAALVPALVREAIDRGWWDPVDGSDPPYASVPAGAPTVHARLDSDLRFAVGVAPLPFTFLRTRPGDRFSMTAAVVQEVVVGAVASAASATGSGREILAVGVTPEHRGHGLATAMLRAHVDSFRSGDEPLFTTITVAERDWVDPLEASLRASVARRLFEGAGFAVRPASRSHRAIDPLALEATLD